MDDKTLGKDETMKDSVSDTTVATPTPAKFRFTFNCASFLAQLINYKLYDSKKYEQSQELSLLIVGTQDVNPMYAEKGFFLFALCSEKLGQLGEKRVFLQQSLSLAMKRMQHGVAAVLINSILRSFINVSYTTITFKFKYIDSRVTNQTDQIGPNSKTGFSYIFVYGLTVLGLA